MCRKTLKREGKPFDEEACEAYAEERLAERIDVIRSEMESVPGGRLDACIAVSQGQYPPRGRSTLTDLPQMTTSPSLHSAKRHRNPSIPIEYASCTSGLRLPESVGQNRHLSSLLVTPMAELGRHFQRPSGDSHHFRTALTCNVL